MTIKSIITSSGITFESFIISLIIGVCIGIFFGFIASSFIKSIKSIKRKAAKKILKQDKEFYEGLDVDGKHIDLKGDVARALGKNNVKDPDKAIATQPKGSLKPVKKPMKDGIPMIITKGVKKKYG